MKIKTYLSVVLCAGVILMLSGCTGKPELEKSPIPEDAVFYLNISDFNGTWQQIKATRFATQLPKLKIWDTDEVSKVFLEIQSEIKSLEASLGTPLNEKTFMSVLGKHLEVAVMPGMPYWTGLIIADVEDESFVSKLLDNATKNIAGIRTEQYKGKELTVMPLKSVKMNLIYFFRDSKLFLASSVETARRCIDIMESKGITLLDTKKFKHISQNQYQKDDDVLYIDWDKIISSVAVLKDFKELNSVASLKALNSQYVTFTWDSGFYGYSTLSFTDQSLFEKIFSKPSNINALAAMVPDKCIVTSIADIDINGFISYQLSVDSTSDVKKSWDQIFTLLNAELGVDIQKESTEWMGNGFIFYMGPLNEAGMLPLPDVVVGLGIKDKEKALAFMHRIEGVLTSSFSEKHLQFSSEMIGDTEYRYIPLPLGNNLSSGYSVTDEYLFIGSSRRSVQSILDTLSGRQAGFSESEIFKNCGMSHSNSIQYYDWRAFFQALNDVVNRYRMLFPQSINPDDIRELLHVLALAPYSYSFSTMDNGFMKGEFHFHVL